MIKISDDLGLCLHPDRITEIVAVARQTGPAYQRTTRSPVKGMLRRRPAAGPAQPFHRATCPDCGSWGASLYWPPVIGPTLVNIREKELT